MTEEKIQNNNKHNTIISRMDCSEELSPKILKFFHHLAAKKGIATHALMLKPFSESGDNSYGQILQVTLVDVNRSGSEIETNRECTFIVKISPKNPLRRVYMRVVEFYAKEVFTYSNVFSEYYTLYEERVRELNVGGNTNKPQKELLPFNVVPQMYCSCLEENDEFLIMEDLSREGYKMNSRMQVPNYNLVMETVRTIAQLHAMSFVLQTRKPHILAALLPNLNEYVFTDNMQTVTQEFAKRYLKRARLLFQQDPQHSKLHIDVLQKLGNHFKTIIVDCVKTDKAIPYAVISHGDFWNNNILYKYDESNKPVSAKMIDFQICRYNAPVLDLVHYLFTSTEKELRDKHFWEFMDCYYTSLDKYLQFYDLSIDQLYPREVFLKQLQDYGIYGFCIAVYSIPFFISNKKEILDFDEVAEAFHSNTSSSSTSSSTSSCASLTSSTQEEENDDNSSVTKCLEEDNNSNEAEKCSELWEEFDMLNERTIPIFKKRMLGILEDVIQYQMLNNLMKL